MRIRPDDSHDFRGPEDGHHSLPVWGKTGLRVVRLRRFHGARRGSGPQVGGYHSGRRDFQGFSQDGPRKIEDICSRDFDKRSVPSRALTGIGPLSTSIQSGDEFWPDETSGLVLRTLPSPNTHSAGADGGCLPAQSVHRGSQCRRHGWNGRLNDASSGHRRLGAGVSIRKPGRATDESLDP